MVSVTLFEGIVLLIISGSFVVAWWGIRRLVKVYDDETIILDQINKSLAIICERLGKSDMWMEMHSKQDDERHSELKRAYQVVVNAVIDRQGQGQG